MASCERTVILEHNRQSLDFREEISTMRTGHLWWSAIGSSLWKDKKFFGNCGDVMRCPVNLDLNIQNYQRLTIFAISTHKDRLLHDSDFVFKISAIGVVFFQDTDSTHWFDPVELQELMDRSAMFLGSESCGFCWMFRCWPEVRVFVWKMLKILWKLNWSSLWFFCSKTLQTRHWGGRLLKATVAFHPKPSWISGTSELMIFLFFLRRPDFGAGVPGYLVCAPGMKLRWFGQTTWVVSLDWRKITPKFEGIEDL